MITKTFILEFVTPAFLGGTDPKKAELRPASIKGVLRFWWRALHGNLSTKQMREKEAQIFGSAQDGIKSKVWLRVKEETQLKKGDQPIDLGKIPDKKNQDKIYSDKKKSGDIFSYMAFGTQKMGSSPAKQYFLDGNRFALTLIFDKRLSSQQMDSVLEALQALSALGGLGAKARNGFGSVQVIKENGKPVSGNWEPREFIKNVFAKRAYKDTDHATPDNVWLLKTVSDWEAAYKKCASLYIMARKKVNIKDRKYIAAPMNIMKGKTPVDSSYNFWKGKISRRSKPYFLTVKKVGNQFLPIIVLMSSKYAAGLKLDANIKKDFERDYVFALQEMNKQLSAMKNEV